MNTYYITDDNFTKSNLYKSYLEANPTYGYLKIRAYAANQAIPISNLKVTISKMLDNDKIIFFDGFTNDSGIIENIALPTPRLDTNNLDIPKTISYDINIYTNDKVTSVYKVDIYEGVYVVQNINVVPDVTSMMGGFNGS